MTHPKLKGNFPPFPTKIIFPFNSLEVKHDPEQWQEMCLKVIFRIYNIEEVKRRMFKIKLSFYNFKEANNLREVYPTFLANLRILRILLLVR